MKMKNVIAAGMTLPQVALTLAQAIDDMGGTDEDLKSLLENRMLCDELATHILRRHIVTIDRVIRTTYPDWVERVMFPRLENAGPSEFDVRKLGKWFYPNQENKAVSGDVIYEHLKGSNMLEEFLNLRDLEEIKKKGKIFFSEHFTYAEKVYGWKSVVKGGKGERFVPYLTGGGVSDVVQGWCLLRYNYGPRDLAIRFTK